MSRKLWLLTAALLFVTGLGLHWIDRSGTDLPPWQEGQAPSERDLTAALERGQAPFASEFALAAQRGQAPYDARVIGVESLGLEVLALGLLLGLLVRELTLREFLIVAVGAVVGLVLSPYAPRPVALSSGLSAITRTLPATDLRALHTFWGTFSTLLPCGHWGFLWALVVSIPSIALSLASVEEVREQRFDHYRIVSLFGLLCVVGLFLMAGFGAQPAAAHMLVFSAVLLNCACYVAQPPRPTLAKLWFTAVLIPFLIPIWGPVPRLVGPSSESPQAGVIRQAVALKKIYTDEALRRVLPDSIRPPIELSASQSTGFVAGAAPALEGLGGLPSWGTWTNATGPFAVGEFTSTPFAGPSGLVQIRIAGTLQPPDSELLLRGGDGQVFTPLSEVVLAPDRWRRINFQVPPGLYQIIARSHDARHWLAFSAPSAINPWGHLAHKWVRSWPWWLAAAAILSALLAWPTLRRPQPQ